MTKTRCRKCGGNLFIGLDESNHIVVYCLQCGWEISGKRINPLKRMANSHNLSQQRMTLYRRENNLCTLCGKPITDEFRDCPKCRKRREVYRVAYRKRHLILGLCRRCHRPVVPNCKHCQVCLDIMKQRRANKHAMIDIKR